MNSEMGYFLCFCLLSLAAKLNFNVSKVVYLLTYFHSLGIYLAATLHGTDKFIGYKITA